jgi:hypothetical protein
MSVPAPSGGDYPSGADLDYIEAWPLDDPLGWFRFLHGCWWAADWGWREESAIDDSDRPVRRFSISTGGWSGNEEIIEAMGRNFLWHVTWMSSRRGGHYVFEVTEAVAGRGEG